MFSVDNSGATMIVLLIILGIVLETIVIAYLKKRREYENTRYDYIDRVVTTLIDLRAELQIASWPEWGLATGDTQLKDIVTTQEFREMEIAYGKAYALMISIDIDEIRKMATEITSEENIKNPSKKLDAIDFAIQRLGKEYGYFND